MYAQIFPCGRIEVKDLRFTNEVRNLHLQCCDAILACNKTNEMK